MALYSQIFPSEISRGNPYQKQVALTFDGGGGLSYTREIADILSALQVPASVFLTGDFMKTHPEHTALLAERGYEIGNHSMTHPWLSLPNSWTTHPRITQNRFNQEMQEAHELFHAITGKSLCNLWRAPYGARSLEVLRWGQQRGLHHAYWTHDTGDWRTDIGDPLSRSGTQIIRDLLAYHDRAPHGLNGAIVLLHLGARRAEDPLYPHLLSFVGRLREQGYSFVSVGQLLQDEQRHIASGDTPLAQPHALPLGDALLQSGWTEGFYEDSWLGPFFSVKLRPMRHGTNIKLKLFVPDLIEKQAVSLHIDGELKLQTTLTSGASHLLECGAPDREFVLDLWFSDCACPALMGTGPDQRNLSAVLDEIVLHP